MHSLKKTIDPSELFSFIDSEIIYTSNQKLNNQKNYSDHMNIISQSQKNGNPLVKLVRIKIKQPSREDASVFIDNMREKIDSNCKLFILDFSETVSMDSAFLGAVILILKQISTKGVEPILIIDIEKFKTLNSIQYSLERLRTKVGIFSSLDQAKDQFQIVKLNYWILNSENQLLSRFTRYSKNSIWVSVTYVLLK